MRNKAGVKMITGILIFMMAFGTIIPAAAILRSRSVHTEQPEMVLLYEHNGEYYDEPYLEDGPVENDLEDAELATGAGAATCSDAVR